eukprot:TRINITY_DN5489_c0_g1_i13.p1 TRINITY_DN5489_c0_g1~~TRINITY_DN5489_c0_g1_i13.p1  ORF type:complete len:360 (-),score=72.98 TRINITY_DN5489_c0_g1_i13:321-1286(-)
MYHKSMSAAASGGQRMVHSGVSTGLLPNAGTSGNMQQHQRVGHPGAPFIGGMQHQRMGHPGGTFGNTSGGMQHHRVGNPNSGPYAPSSSSSMQHPHQHQRVGNPVSHPTASTSYVPPTPSSSTGPTTANMARNDPLRDGAADIGDLDSLDTFRSPQELGGYNAKNSLYYDPLESFLSAPPPPATSGRSTTDGGGVEGVGAGMVAPGFMDKRHKFGRQEKYARSDDYLSTPGPLRNPAVPASSSSNTTPGTSTTSNNGGSLPPLMTALNPSNLSGTEPISPPPAPPDYLGGSIDGNNGGNSSGNGNNNSQQQYMQDSGLDYY